MASTCGWEYGGLRIEGVENGFIVSSGSEKWVFTNIASALKFIGDSFKESK
jgi:hypothetical protein